METTLLRNKDLLSDDWLARSVLPAPTMQPATVTNSSSQMTKTSKATRQQKKAIEIIAVAPTIKKPSKAAVKKKH